MTRETVRIVCFFTIFVSLSAAAAPTGPALETDEQKTLYSLGLALSQNLQFFQLSGTDVALIASGLEDGALLREARVPIETYGPKIDELLKSRLGVVAEREKTLATTLLDEAGKKPGAKRTESGLVYVELAPGSGEVPSPKATVKLHYEGTLRTGEVFDTTRAGGEPATVPLATAPPCLAEGIAGMQVGGKRRLVCPAALAYGDAGRPPIIPPGAALVLEVELVGIIPEPAESSPVP